MTGRVGFGSAGIRHALWLRGSTEKHGDHIMSKSLIVILAVTLGTSFAAPAFAFDPQPDPTAGNSLQSSQTTTKAKTYTDGGRTLADYNIQKE
jgi:hypothetical protein